jgi:hypothetical protein
MLAASLIGLAASHPANATGSCGNRFDFALQRQLAVTGLTADQKLVRFRECSPDRSREIGQISGLLAPDTKLVGLDYRVQDGQLYGLGDGGGIYTLDPYTAAATQVSKLTKPLRGTQFGVDFNPAANALRIISDQGQNLRHPFATLVTVEDTDLVYPATPTAPAATGVGVTGAAYTNNDLDPNTATTLFDIDSQRNQVVIQSPPNAGVLTATGSLTVDPDSPVGFDIYSRLRNGVTIGNSGFAALIVGGQSGFYRMNFLTGKAILIDKFDEPVMDIAIPLDQ